MLNEHSLPEWLCKTIAHVGSKYNPGEKTDYSATSLLKPPYLAALERVHKHEIEGDPSDQLASFIGTSIHNSVEEALQGDERYIVEKRFYREIDGFVISGQIDLYDKATKTLSDHKANSVYKLYKSDDRFDYEAQLAIGRWLLAAAGYVVERAAINGFVTDWRSSEAKRDSSYPQSRFTQLHIPLWSLDNTEQFIRERIKLHEDARQGFGKPCDSRERWSRPGAWAVKKNGRKTAVRVLESESEAIKLTAELGKDHFIEHREGEDIRCTGYCSVASWCSFFQRKYGRANELV